MEMELYDVERVIKDTVTRINILLISTAEKIESIARLICLIDLPKTRELETVTVSRYQVTTPSERVGDLMPLYTELKVRYDRQTKVLLQVVLPLSEEKDLSKIEEIRILCTGINETDFKTLSFDELSSLYEQRESLRLDIATLRTLEIQKDGFASAFNHRLKYLDCIL
jgi:hypothetical protein